MGGIRICSDMLATTCSQAAGLSNLARLGSTCILIQIGQRTRLDAPRAPGCGAYTRARYIDIDTAAHTAGLARQRDDAVAQIGGFGCGPSGRRRIVRDIAEAESVLRELGIEVSERRSS